MGPSVAGALALVLGVPMDAEHVRAFLEDPSRAVRRQPVALQVVEVLRLVDLLFGTRAAA